METPLTAGRSTLRAIKAQVRGTQFIRYLEAASVENDGFNRARLQPPGSTGARSSVLRAYSRYLRQTAIPFSQAYMEETLASRITEITRMRWSSCSSGDLRSGAGRGASEDKQTRRRMSDHAEAKTSRPRNSMRSPIWTKTEFCSRFLPMSIQASLRTNYYQPGAKMANRRAIISIKLDSARHRRSAIAASRWREIFVYSARVEGDALYGVAGSRAAALRWSDRREDFRTEILGLMKAQMTKNAVIVPVGAKGGFVLKQPPPADAEGREAFSRPKASNATARFSCRGLLDHHRQSRSPAAS